MSALNRREALLAAGAAGLDAASCLLQRNVTEGPYREAGNRALLELRRKGSRVSAGYTGSLVIGVSPGH